MDPTRKKDATTVSWRPIMNPGRFSPLPLKRRSQVLRPKKEVPRSLAGSLATAKKAICIPSSMPTIAMKKKNRKTETPGVMEGYLLLIEVCPLKRATSVAAKQKPRMATDITTRPQKKAKVNPVLGSSLVMMGFPLIPDRMFWMRYEAVHDSRELDDHGGVEGEQSKVVVDGVDHAVRRVDLGRELSEDAREDDHSESGHVEEDGLDARGEAEDDEEDHELTAHEVAVEVVTLEGDGGVLVGHGVAVLVEVRVNGRKADEGRLLSLDHGQPEHGEDENDEGDPWAGLLGNTGVLREDEGSDEDHGENHESEGRDILEREQGRQLHVVGAVVVVGLLDHRGGCGGFGCTHLGFYFFVG